MESEYEDEEAWYKHATRRVRKLLRVSRGTCDVSFFAYMAYQTRKGHGVMFQLALRRLRRYLLRDLSCNIFSKCFNAFRRALFCLVIFYANYLYFQLLFRVDQSRCQCSSIQAWIDEIATKADPGRPPKMAIFAIFGILTPRGDPPPLLACPSANPPLLRPPRETPSPALGHSRGDQPPATPDTTALTTHRTTSSRTSQTSRSP